MWGNYLICCCWLKPCKRICNFPLCISHVTWPQQTVIVGCTVEVWEWLNIFIPQFTTHAIFIHAGIKVNPYKLAEPLGFEMHCNTDWLRIGPCLNITPSHVWVFYLLDTTIVRPSYHCNGNPLTDKTTYIETIPMCSGTGREYFYESILPHFGPVIIRDCFFAMCHIMFFLFFFWNSFPHVAFREFPFLCYCYKKHMTCAVTKLHKPHIAPTTIHYQSYRKFDGNFSKWYTNIPFWASDILTFFFDIID